MNLENPRTLKTQENVKKIPSRLKSPELQFFKDANFS